MSFQVSAACAFCTHYIGFTTFPELKTIILNHKKCPGASGRILSLVYLSTAFKILEECFYTMKVKQEVSELFIFSRIWKVAAISFHVSFFGAGAARNCVE